MAEAAQAVQLDKQRVDVIIDALESEAALHNLAAALNQHEERQCEFCCLAHLLRQTKLAGADGPAWRALMSVAMACADPEESYKDMLVLGFIVARRYYLTEAADRVFGGYA